MRYFILVTLTALAFAGSSPAQTVYVIGDSNQFGSFDLGTLAYTEISSSLGTGGLYRGLASDGSGGLYAAYNPVFTNTYQFNSLTTGGTLTPVGSLQSSTNLRGLSLDGTGTLFGYNSDGNTVGTVNTSTGVYTSIGLTGTILSGSNGGTLAFAGASLYQVGTDTFSFESHLYSIDTATGAASAIGADDSTYDRMVAFSVGTDLYGVKDTTVYSINVGTGGVSTVGSLTGTSLPSQFTAAVSFTPVPEPATVGLAAAAGLGVAGWVRRKRAGRAAVNA